MPTTVSYPGVYIEEIPSGVRTIVGVATSITAFIGAARKGPTNQPIRIQSFSDFERQFGELWVQSPLSYAVQHFFQNGGTDAIIIRVVHSDPNNAAVSALAASTAVGGLNLRASSEGEWGNDLIAETDVDARPLQPGDGAIPLFNLKIKMKIRGGLRPNQEETVEFFRNLSTDPNSRRFVTQVLQESALVRVAQDPSPTPVTVDRKDFTGGADGTAPTYSEYQDVFELGAALDQADLFNLLCLPPRSLEKEDSLYDDPAGPGLLTQALDYCNKRRAMLIIDPPPTPVSGWRSMQAVMNEIAKLGVSTYRENAVLFFPAIRMANPLKENRIEEFPSCGVIAGVFARTDGQRGVWKAPAGIEATLAGVRELSFKMTDGQNGELNPKGYNCLRTFPVYGNIVWGARTLAGADELASDWKYVPVRRLALFLEESLYRGTKWVVFEPNDEPLWAQIRLNIGTFMNNLFRQGAFQGSSPREAYFVKCDKETTTQADIDLGIVNIVVGYAPLKPAEFVIIKFQQMTRESVAS
jgi:phage tail sheath protein FI